MNRRHRGEKEDDYGDDFRKDTGAEKDEGCNAYYTRKQRTLKSELAPDTDADLVDKDDSFSESRNYPNQDSGPLNTPWSKDRYGK